MFLHFQGELEDGGLAGSKYDLRLFLKSRTFKIVLRGRSVADVLLKARPLQKRIQADMELLKVHEKELLGSRHPEKREQHGEYHVFCEMCPLISTSRLYYQPVTKTGKKW